jgi:ABC-type siderophore export system fused ATPase/permease subunit
MSRRLTSTLLLFAIGVGFFIFGITHILSAVDTEDYVIYSLYLLTALIAFVAILRLPRKSDKG